MELEIYVLEKLKDHRQLELERRFLYNIQLSKNKGIMVSVQKLLSEIIAAPHQVLTHTEEKGSAKEDGIPLNSPPVLGSQPSPEDKCCPAEIAGGRSRG